MILHHPDPYVRTLIDQGSEDSPYLGFKHTYNDFKHFSLQPGPTLTPTDKEQILDIRLLANKRVHTWPFASDEFAGHPTECIYSSVRSFDTSNETGAWIPVPTGLDTGKWENIATGHSDDSVVLNGIKYGFSLQYTGPALHEIPIEMHASGQKFKEHIRAYLQEEKKYKAMADPFKKPPFEGWCCTSPIMTRPKTNSKKRHIIVDLSYPPDSNVNSGVYKNNYYGSYIGHTLPRIRDVIEKIDQREYNVALATLDIRRAYRNFPGCAFDYPLNVIKCDNEYFIDLAMPFGAQSSSTYMQKISEFVIRALSQRGIATVIYLDDVIFYFLPQHDPPARLREAIELLKALGLPLAEEKIQPLAQSVKYLG